MIGTLGGPELILILVIALIVFGPRKLPDIGKSIGKMMVEFRKASADFKRTVEDEVEAERRKPAARIAAPAAPVTSEAPAAPTPRAPEEGAPQARGDAPEPDASAPPEGDAAASETP